jgi:hypothetical protein
MDDHHESLIESIEIDCEEPYRSQFFDRVKNVCGQFEVSWGGQMVKRSLLINLLFARTTPDII